MFKLSKWAKLWILWAILGIIIEGFAAFGAHHRGHPRTLTEFMRWLFPKKLRRIILVGLMALLTWHFWANDIKSVQPIFQESPCEH